MNELNHRVKNTLATVQSLAAQSFRDENMKTAVSQFEGRLVALARAHDVLTRENWQGIDLQELIRQTVSAVCVDPERRFEIEGPPLCLRPRLALSLSLAFHELVTNAAKYGALSNDKGRIRVKWTVNSADRDARVHLRWQEMYGPEVARPKKKGFGSRLLERALGRDCAAEVTLSFEPPGVICAIQLPLA